MQMRAEEAAVAMSVCSFAIKWLCVIFSVLYCQYDIAHANYLMLVSGQAMTHFAYCVLSDLVETLILLYFRDK